jgi:hypothetical protein
VPDATGQEAVPLSVAGREPITLAYFPHHARRRPLRTFVVGHLLIEKRIPPEGIQ